MSDPTPTQDRLPWLVVHGLDLCEQRLSGGVGSATYESIRNQLAWIDGALAASGPPDVNRLESLTLSVLAARELEQTDPELADVCFNVHYLLARHEWPQAPAGHDQRSLFVERLAQRQTGLLAVAVVVITSAAVLFVLAFAIPHAAPAARIVMVACGVVFGCTGGTIAWIVATAPARRRRLLATIDRHPERVARVYGAVIVSHGFRQANLRPIAAPEADHLPLRGGGLYVVIELADPTPRERRLGLHREAVAVERDEVLALLEWLRGRAPGAAGPPATAGIVRAS